MIFIASFRLGVNERTVCFEGTSKPLSLSEIHAECYSLPCLLPRGISYSHAIRISFETARCARFARTDFILTALQFP